MSTNSQNLGQSQTARPKALQPDPPAPQEDNTPREDRRPATGEEQDKTPTEEEPRPESEDQEQEQEQKQRQKLRPQNMEEAIARITELENKIDGISRFADRQEKQLQIITKEREQERTLKNRYILSTQPGLRRDDFRTTKDHEEALAEALDYVGKGVKIERVAKMFASVPLLETGQQRVKTKQGSITIGEQHELPNYKSDEKGTDKQNGSSDSRDPYEFEKMILPSGGT